MDKFKRQNREIFAVIEEAFIDADGRLLSSVKQEPVKEVVKEVVEPVAVPIVEPVQEPVQEVVEPIQEPVEEVSEPAEEYAFIQDIAPADDAVAITSDDVVEVKKEKVISKTFAMKMLEASDVLQDRYDELLNYAARFKKVKPRISRKFDSINQGRLQFVKLSVAGKTLKLYLNMDINSVDPKYHCKDMSDKKTYVTVPVLLRIKSGRAVKYAKRLIDQCAELYGFKENKKYQEIDAIARIEAFQQAKEDKNEENDND